MHPLIRGPTPDCDLQDSIVVDEEAVTFHLATPDPELPLKLAMPFAFPVPADTPAEDQGMEPVPATGPYVIAEAGTEVHRAGEEPGVPRSGRPRRNRMGSSTRSRGGSGRRTSPERSTGSRSGSVDVMLEHPDPRGPRDPPFGASRSGSIVLAGCLHAVRGLRRPEAAVRRRTGSGRRSTTRSIASMCVDILGGLHDPAPDLSDPAAEPARATRRSAPTPLDPDVRRLVGPGHGSSAEP